MRFGDFRCLFLSLLLILLVACSNGGGPYSLTIAHLNDTHSHLEATPVNLDLGGVKTGLLLGGFARLQTLINEMRSSEKNFLLLHAGDAVQGTLYFTLFDGVPEFAFLNRLGVDVMTFGNHEFDRGAGAIPNFLNLAAFPLVSSNIDFSGEPAIAPMVKKQLIRTIGKERVGFIGLTTETTPQTTLDVGKAVFLDAVTSVREQVADLELQGVNKIILLSHLGYAGDLRLASLVDGVDVIVGGHSHTLLGAEASLATLGLTPEGGYPTMVKSPSGGKTLVVQAWQWGNFLGKLALDFDPEGRVTSCNGKGTIPVGPTFTRNGAVVPPDSDAYAEISRILNQTGVARVVDEDPAITAVLAPYMLKLAAFRRETVAISGQDLVRGVNRGPGPLVADSMLAAVPGAVAAILNYGGVRKDLPAGSISVSDILEVMPFANSLILVDLTGEELQRGLEDTIDFLLTKYGKQTPLALPYVAGIQFSVNPSASRGERVASLVVKRGDGIFQPVSRTAVYRTVVNSFVANGGDGFNTVRSARAFRSDTGITDSEAFRDYLHSLGTVYSRDEQRVSVIGE